MASKSSADVEHGLKGIPQLQEPTEVAKQSLKGVEEDIRRLSLDKESVEEDISCLMAVVHEAGLMGLEVQGYEHRLTSLAWVADCKKVNVRKEAFRKEKKRHLLDDWFDLEEEKKIILQELEEVEKELERNIEKSSLCDQVSTDLASTPIDPTAKKNILLEDLKGLEEDNKKMVLKLDRVEKEFWEILESSSLCDKVFTAMTSRPIDPKTKNKYIYF